MNKIFFSILFAMFALISCGNSEVVKEKTVTEIVKTDTTISFYLYVKDKGEKVVVIRGKADKPIPPIAKGDYNDNLVVKFSTLQSAVDKDNKGNSNYVVYASEKNGLLNIQQLQPNTAYSFDIYLSSKEGQVRLLETFDIVTFAPMPSEPANNIMFSHVTDTNIGVGWKDGNGKKRIVIVSKDTTPVMPKNGQNYLALPEFGNKANQIPGTNTYVVYNGGVKKDLFIDVKLPESGKYFFYVAEYNGEGESTVYNLTTSAVNPRFKVTKLPSPVANNVTKFFDETYEVSWSKVEGVEYYEIQVAYDKDFTKFVDTYDNANVGDANEFEIYAGDKSETFYYRVRAVVAGNVSEFSNTVEVKFKKKK